MPTAEELKSIYKLPRIPGYVDGEDLLKRSYHTQLAPGTKGSSVTPQKTLAVPVSSTSDAAKMTWTAGGVSKSVFGPNTGLPGSGTCASQQGVSGGAVVGSSQEMGAPDLSERVLCFHAFFRERVHESQVEKDRVRKVRILYYLEDGTLSVVEPPQDNSGIPQGTFIKRHLVPTPDGSKTITFDMLNVGESIQIYGREFFIVDCDDFTRQFMASIGVDVPESMEAPEDAHATLQKRPRKIANVPPISETNSSTKLSREEVAAAMQFYENDGNCLHMRGTWDDSKRLYGKTNYFHIYYMLSDDTWAVVEVLQPNSGKDPFPLYIRRNKMPKPREGSTKYETKTTSLTFEGKDSGQEIYTDRDIRIGARLNFFGREFTITDYDQHTRDHLREKFGITEYAPMKSNLEPPKEEPVPTKVPPYNGWGTEEDSLSSCGKLELKAPRKDYQKIGRFGSSSVKFALRLDDNQIVNAIRRFVLTCYLVDDTIAIYEPVQRNSGITAGKFLQRQRVKNPETDKYFVAGDFHLGKRVIISGFPFMVLATDEHSMSYMEQNASYFPQCNINTICEKVQAMLRSSRTGLLDALNERDNNGQGSLDYHEFAAIAKNLNLDLSEQEILTLLRYFDRNGDGYISYAEFVSRVMPEGTQLAVDDRPWEEIYGASSCKEHNGLSTKDKFDMQKSRVDTTTAAYAARAFEEAYNQRRTHFLQHFKFICDYSPDGRISAREFQMCCTKKLKLSLTQPQLDALSDRLFPEGMRRLPYEEFVRIINNYSTNNNNLKDIWASHLKEK